MFRALLVSTLLFLSGCIHTPSSAPDGWVVLAFDVDAMGIPQNIVVLESYPENVFDEEAISAVKQWKYKPKTVDGKPVVQKDKKVRLDFNKDDKSQ